MLIYNVRLCLDADIFIGWIILFLFLRVKYLNSNSLTEVTETFVKKARDCEHCPVCVNERENLDGQSSV
jgi:hypothetical protein